MVKISLREKSYIFGIPEVYLDMMAMFMTTIVQSPLKSTHPKE